MTDIGCRYTKFNLALQLRAQHRHSYVHEAEGSCINFCLQVAGCSFILKVSSILLSCTVTGIILSPLKYNMPQILPSHGLEVNILICIRRIQHSKPNPTERKQTIKMTVISREEEVIETNKHKHIGMNQDLSMDCRRIVLV